MMPSGKAGRFCVPVQVIMAIGALNRVVRSMCNACTILPVLLAIVVTTTQAPPAMAEARYAAMSVDANTGKMLHAEAADAPRYPASLTKVMTLYIVFEQMRLGQLKPSTMLHISPEAASAPPSKLGLKPGSTIAVSDAIKALVTRSANDIAVAVAEHIAGSEERFAHLMTRRAHELGMRATTFRNASGLPDPAQTTTARDMLTLALRLYDAFPREARLFSLRSFNYAGRNHRNHNTLLASFAGMDGIKTGYTRASGFNLLASVQRDGRHVVAVVMGGTSASSRNARMRVILSRALQQASTERTRRRLVVAAQSVPRPAPAAKRPPADTAAAPRLIEPMVPAGPAAADRSPSRDRAETWRSEVRLAAPIEVGTSVASRVGANTGWQPTIEPDAAPARPPSTLQAQAAYLAASPPFAPARAPHEAAVRRGRAEIQIGAFADAAEARDRLATARELSPRLLGDAIMAVPTVTVGGRTLYRARFVGLDASTAVSACADLRRRRLDCLIARSE